MRNMLLTEHWVVVDVETTGFSPGRDRIIEIGAVAGEGQRITDEFQTLIDPGRPVPKQAQRVHRISDAMLRGEPCAGEVLPDFHRFIGASVLVAHNAQFDVAFLRHEFGRLGLGLPNPSHCTLRLSRSALPTLPNHRLETVARHLFGPLDKDMHLHRALADARLTARVWMALNVGAR